MLAVLISSVAIPARAQDPIEQAADQYVGAQRAHDLLLSQSPGSRTRSDYLRVLHAYERTYIITPHTGYADDALLNVALLYEEIGEIGFAERTWRFLISDYPASRFISRALDELDRLESMKGEVAAAPADAAAPVAESAAEPAPAPFENPVDTTDIANVNGVRFWESDRSVRVVVDMDRGTTFRIGDAFEPPRVFLDLAASRVGRSVTERTVAVDAPSLASIRIGQFDPTTVRIVLDMTTREHVDAFLLSNPQRLVVDIRAPENGLNFSREDPYRTSESPQDASPVQETDAGAPTVETAASPVPSVETPATPPVLAEVAVVPEMVSTPASPTLNGDHSLIRSLGLKIGRVVIDPGHGGHDTGTIGPSGVLEKDVVLGIAQELKARVESELGAEVVLTRNDDTFVPLETRTALANQAKADLFLSIHVNSSSSGSVRGFETYVLNMATTSADREIAARENAASQASISELQDLVSKIMFQDKADESREFATRVQQAMADGGDFGRDRGVKQAPFVVLIGAEMPSILAEVSFISNPADEERLSGDAGRREIVDALFEGVRSYTETLSGFHTAAAQP